MLDTDHRVLILPIALAMFYLPVALTSACPRSMTAANKTNILPGRTVREVRDGVGRNPRRQEGVRRHASHPRRRYLDRRRRVRRAGRAVRLRQVDAFAHDR